MLQITPAATNHLVRVRTERGRKDSEAARFVSKGSRVGLTFAAKPGPEDRVLEGDDISVYVAPEVAEALDNSIIDARVEDGKAILVMRRQQEATATPARPTKSTKRARPS